jgi:lysine 2,3-aminomutase
MAQGFFIERYRGSPNEAIKQWAATLWEGHPWVYRALRRAKDLETARRHLYDRMVERERAISAREIKVHPLEWCIIRDSSRVMRNILSRRCEKLSGFSGLECLWKMARGRWEEVPKGLTPAFFEEFYRLFNGVKGKSGIYEWAESPTYTKLKGREAALARSDELDGLAEYAESRIDSYTSGLDQEIIARRRKNQRRIMRVLGATADRWSDWRWHLKHVIRDEAELGLLIELTDDEREAIHLAKKHQIPFGVTPYYCSLMDQKPNRDDDHAVRAQVIPTKYYVERMIEHRKKGIHSADFMMEHDTSPVDTVVRRYPRVSIFKPYNTCAQICVYCQRNWEITDVLCPRALASKQVMDRAVKWFEKHPMMREVLITGGDPLVMDDDLIERILARLSRIPHVERIRIASRTPAVLPFRITDRLISILARHHRPPQRELCFVTHIEHPFEVTPEMAQAVQRLRKIGLSVYNQMVLTMENSRRFEAVATRLSIKRIGVDPYYTFMMKGKEETDEMRVPIARALQEQKEEARLVPGTVRTDETVYNVPRLGKNYIRAWQHHEVIGIMPDGRRALEFYPWEKNISLAETYIDKDVPIYNYLEELARRGEDLREYESVWYYY